MKHRSLLLKKRILLLLTLLCLAIASLQSGAATIIVVTNTNDSGSGSLRDALTIATPGDTITFAVEGTIVLTSGGLAVNKDVIISGPGANLLAISGNGRHRVFSVRGPNVAASISGLTISNGSGDGGGIWNLLAELTVNDCIITNNVAERYGGGIYNHAGVGFEAKITISNSTIAGNSAPRGGGGGIFNFNSDLEHGGATVVINDCTISGNTAHNGGGIYNWSEARRNGSRAATVMVNNSSISGNVANNSGGGIYNAAFPGPPLFGIARLIVNNSTISGNSAMLIGGGLFNAAASATIGQTILKKGSSGQNIYRQSGTVTSVGYNLTDDNGGGFLNGPDDQINTDPLLGPLQNNGGATLTHALLPGSPAIDRGNPSFTPPPDYDQRDCPFDRVFNGRIDVGSFESQSHPQRPPCSSPRPRPSPSPRRSQ